MGERTVVLVDGSNMAAGGRRYGLMVDYGQVLQWVKRGGPTTPTGAVSRGLGHKRDLIKATVYIGPSQQGGGDGASARQRFIKMVESLGYQVCVACEEGDGSKSCVDRDIIMDALIYGLGGHIDTLVLLSGDGGFTRLARALTSVGVHVIVCGFEDTPEVLRSAASQFVDLGIPSLPGGPLTRVRGTMVVDEA